MITRPMLATEVIDINKLIWPMIASPKVDGIRCLNINGKILSRSFKPIPNDHIRTTLEKHLPKWADGELFSSDNFSKVTSDVMTQSGKPDFVFYMFDYVPDGNINTPYNLRLKKMVEWYKQASHESKKYIKILPFKLLVSLEELKEYERNVLKDGFEGVMLRDVEGPYKCGRSTWKQRLLLKLKVFLDSDAIIDGFEEQMSNKNTIEKNELGLSKRSSCKSGMVKTGLLGNFLCTDVHTGVKFKCGSGKGLTQKLRKEIWNNKEKYIGKIFKYKYQPHGVKDRPRLPIWLGFRNKKDMD